MPKVYIKSLLIKFADDTVIGSMINNDGTAVIQSEQNCFTSWACSIKTCTHTAARSASHLCTAPASNSQNATML